MKAAVVAAVTLAVLVVGSSAGMADAPKFHRATSSVNDDGALVVSFDERGLGNENIDYTLTADATALYACINGGGKHPQAANKEAFEGQVSGGASFEPKNGRVVESITAGPLLAPSFTGPDARPRGRDLHEHRADRYHERRQHGRPGRVADVLRRVDRP